jgi:hypothetical protein
MADGLTADVARAQLGVLVGELLQGPHDYALPVDWVAELEVNGTAWALLEDNDPDEACQGREPLPRVTGLGVPTEIEARRMIEARFRFFPWAKV